MKQATVTRLAPSPTGFLHLGNAWSFLWAWLWARSQKGRVLLRMEDIDPARSKPEFASAILEDLAWLGLDFDGDVVWQSARSEIYLEALQRLERAGHTYPCYCTRKELRTLAGAPHIDDTGAPYPGICRMLNTHERRQKEAEGRRACLRLRCPSHGDIHFIDGIYGQQRFQWDMLGGDFALRRSDGVIAYQIAVVADDAAQGVTHVLRGSDILISTPRQIWLQKLLGFQSVHYAHVPLLLDADGERLAKRHKSLSLRALREQGIHAERIIGLLAALAGWQQEVLPMHPKDLIPCFCLRPRVLCDAKAEHAIRLLPEHIDKLRIRSS